MNKENNEVVTLNDGFDGFRIFSHPDFSDVRTKVIDDEPWFVGRDVATALGYTNTRKAIADHVDDEDKGVTKCDTPGGVQELVVVNESGVYSLTFSSKLPKAKQFKRWVTSEVLPALRKSGTYSVVNPMEQPLSREEMAMYWTNLMAMFRDYTQILERREKSRDEVLDKVISNQAELYKSLSLSQKLYQDAATKFFDAVKETKDKSYSSKEIVEKPFATPKLTNNSWINAANDSVLSIAKESRKDIPAQYREVYALMRKNGHKINKVIGTKLIDTISKNKKLRDGFDSAINDLNKKYKVKVMGTTTNQPHVCKSILIKQIPENIKAEIKAYAKKKNMSYKFACGKIYKRIEELGKLSLDAMMREYSHKIGFTRCSKYYMIANNKYLMDLFNKVMQEA